MARRAAHKGLGGINGFTSMELGLSAIVSLGKAILDFISGRVRIDAQVWSVPDEEIHIFNESDKPVAIRHWRLVWRKQVRKFPPKYKYDEQDVGIEGWEDRFFKINGKEKTLVTFDDQNSFPWNPPWREGEQLFLELWIGRAKKPKRLHLHDVYIHKPKEVTD